MATMTRQAGAEASHAMRLGARAGYAARGVVYLLVGFLVLWSCTRGGGQAEGSTGALQSIADEPFGTLLLWLIAVGLAAFALWRLIQAIRDPDGQGTDAKGLTIRGAMLVSAVLHGALAFTAASIAQGSGSGEGGQGWSAQLMQESWGRWLVILAGLAVIGAGIAQVVKGWKGSFMKYFDTTAAELGTLYTVCRFGLVARGVVFGIIGYLIAHAAWNYQPQQTDGLRGAFQLIMQQPYGVVLLAIVGLGMLAFAVYCFVEARHRIVRVH